MKKLASVLGIIGAFTLTACCSNARTTELENTVVEKMDDTVVAKKGDIVVIDFAGFDNGVQFAGGTAENYPLILGSGAFIPGFEDQLVGAKIGEQRDVNVRFPNNYPATQLAGHEVVFKVTIKEIK